MGILRISTRRRGGYNREGGVMVLKGPREFILIKVILTKD
jgi:hypothetical protein